MRARQHLSLVRRVQLHRAARVREIVGVGVGIVIRPFRPLPVPLLVRGRRPSARRTSNNRASMRDRVTRSSVDARRVSRRERARSMQDNARAHFSRHRAR